MKTEITNNPLTIEFPPLLNVPRQFFEIAAATTVVSTVLRIHFFYPLHAARHFASLERTHRVYLAISHFLTHSRKNTNLHEHPSATETRKTEEEEEEKKTAVVTRATVRSASIASVVRLSREEKFPPGDESTDTNERGETQTFAGTRAARSVDRDSRGEVACCSALDLCEGER